jgi:hypothetical protein
MRNNKDTNLIFKEIENIALLIDSFINLRDSNDLKVIKNELFILEENLKEITKLKTKKDKVKIKFLENILEKLNIVLINLEKIKNNQPLAYFINLDKMTEILIKNVYRYSEYDDNNEELRFLIKEDYKTLKAYEESSKRILLTYLIENPSNMKEVLSLIKVGEMYVCIMESILNSIDYCFGIEK